MEFDRDKTRPEREIGDSKRMDIELTKEEIEHEIADKENSEVIRKKLRREIDNEDQPITSI